MKITKLVAGIMICSGTVNGMFGLGTWWNEFKASLKEYNEKRTEEYKDMSPLEKEE